MNMIIRKIITMIHILYILFVIFAPFIDSNYILLLHITMLPFMMLHWICQNNACFLTMVEKTLRRIFGAKDDKNCITCKIFEPIYDFTKNNKYTTQIYMITVLLLSLSLSRLYGKFRVGEIKNYSDLFLL